MTLTDEEIRFRALELNAEWNKTIGDFSARGVGPAVKLSLFSPLVDEIVEYVKTGKKPVQIKEE